MIKFAVRDIKVAGLDFEQSVPIEGIGLSTEEVDIRSNLLVKGKLYRADSTILADVHVSADFGFFCARCLEDFSHKEEHEYHFDFEVNPEEEYVDVGEEIRQEIIMANPARVLCKDDCKGICPDCGANLNVEKCSCKK